jgi:hypothetical protein
VQARESLLKGISTIDFLGLTSSDQLLFILKLYISILTKQKILVRGSMLLILPLQDGLTEVGNGRESTVNRAMDGSIYPS